MFNLENQNSSVTNLNIRVEKHGDERKTAVDVKLVVDVPAERLNDLHPGLCESIYRQPTKGDQISLIDKQAEKAFTVLLHPCLEPLRLKQKFPGYELTIAPMDSLADEEGLFLADVEIKNFTITPHEGGTTTIAFSAGSQVDEDEIAALLSFLRTEDARITLTPPSKAAAEVPDQLAA